MRGMSNPRPLDTRFKASARVSTSSCAFVGERASPKRDVKSLQLVISATANLFCRDESVNIKLSSIYLPFRVKHRSQSCRGFDLNIQHWHQPHQCEPVAHKGAVFYAELAKRWGYINFRRGYRCAGSIHVP